MLNTLEFIFWSTTGVLLYVMVIYPVVVNIIGFLRFRKNPDTKISTPSVSLIIPAHNEESVLAEKLENALSITYPSEKLEILVVNDGSDDRTSKIAHSFSGRGVRVLDFQERRGKASILNDSVTHATGEVLCFCDANVMFHADALYRMITHLSDKGVGAVSGDVRLSSEQANFGQGEHLYYKIERWVHSGESRAGSMIGVDGGMYILWKDLFRPIPSHMILDDFSVSMHILRQRRIVYDPTAIATENGTPSARQEFRRRMRVSAGAVQSIKEGAWPPWWRPIEVWQYLSHKVLRWLGPVWLLLLLISNCMLWKQGPFYQATLIAQVTVYLLAGLATLSVQFRETRLGGIPFYFTISHVAMAIGLIKGLFNRQRVTWNRTERISSKSETDRKLQLTKNPS